MRVGPSEPVCRDRFQTTFGGLSSKAMVVSTEGKSLAKTRSGDRQKRTAREPLRKCRKQRDDVKTAGDCYCGIKLRRNLFTGGVASGMRGGLSLPKRRLSGTRETPMLTETPRVAEP